MLLRVIFLTCWPRNRVELLLFTVAVSLGLLRLCFSNI